MLQPHGFEMQINNRKCGLDDPVAPVKTAQVEFTAPADLRGSEECSTHLWVMPLKQGPSAKGSVGGLVHERISLLRAETAKRRDQAPEPG
jgi:hypothetical protein